MKMSLFYLVFVTVLFAHSGFAQSGQRMTQIKMENESFELLFTKLQAQTGLSFVLPGKISTYEKISLPYGERTVNEVLDLVLNKMGLKYRFSGDVVYVYRDIRAGVDSTASGQSSVNGVSIVKLTGSVRDATSRLPLPGVNILVRGTNRGTTTDSDGYFTIDVQEREHLVFSFIGFKTLEVQVGIKSILEVAMEEEISALKEVVINAGYYETTDKTKTGNIVKVTSEDIEKQPVTSPLMALQGRVAGLDIKPVIGTPGSAPRIRIRGENSLRFDGGYPLYVIDGIPVDASPLPSSNGTLMAAGFDPLGTIDPTNIESIEVLKDGDATAIYGSRGANGVILITTKKAAKLNKTNLDISVYQGVGQVGNKMDLLNTQQYLEMRREALKNSGHTSYRPEWNEFDINGTWDSTRYTDWQDVLLGGTANITNLQTTVSAGNSNTSFKTGGGVRRETMVFPGDFRFQQISVNLSVNHSSPDGKLKFFISNNYGFNKHRIFDGFFVSDALNLPPHAPELYDEDGNLNWQLVPRNGRLVSSWRNPLNRLKVSHDATTANLVSNGGIDYEIMPRLNFKTSFGYNETRSEEVVKEPISSKNPTLPNLRGSARFGNNERKSWMLEPQVNYATKINEHSFSVTIGGTWQHSLTKRQLTIGNGYTSDALLSTIRGAETVLYSNDDFNEYKYAAVFGRIGYDWKNKYLVNITGRRDGSSRFGPNKRFGNFGALGLAWIFSSEAFIRDNLPFLSFGKLRMSYGTSGNDQIGDYRFYSLYNVNTDQYQDGMTLSPNSLYNPDFTWELTKKLECGIQVGLFDDRISMEGAWYRNRSSNQLIDYQLPATTGFASVQSNFNATVENSGWELVVNTDNVRSSKFKWTTSLNLTVPSNRLIAFPGIENSPYSKTYKVGESLSIQRLYVWSGVDPITGLHEVVDQNEDGFINDDDKVFTNALTKKYYGGLNNRIVFGPFELTLLFQFISQNSRMYQMAGFPGYPSNAPVEVLGRWQRKGDITNIQKFTDQSSLDRVAAGNAMESTYVIQDASFVRLKTMSLSYTFSSRFLKRIRAEACNVFVQGQNLFTITGYNNLDPETGDKLPPLRMFSGGIQLRF